MVAVNVGGALVPTVVSVYLLAHTERWWQGALAIFLVAAVVHVFATPVLPIVVFGMKALSRLRVWTQPVWPVLLVLPFVGVPNRDRAFRGVCASSVTADPGP